jgi:hypothetical protein
LVNLLPLPKEGASFQTPLGFLEIPILKAKQLTTKLSVSLIRKLISYLINQEYLTKISKKISSPRWHQG